MNSMAAGMAAGALVFHQLASIPSGWWVLPPLLGAVLLVRQRGICLLLAGICFGFTVSHLQALWRLPSSLPAAVLQGPVLIEGRIDSLVQRRGDRATFEFQIASIGTATGKLQGSWRLRCNWYRTDQLPQPGQSWRLRVRIKPVHGYANAGGFDYEGWLYHRGIRYQGYVVDDALLLEDGGQTLHRVRQSISDHIAAAVRDPAVAGVLRALAVGDRSGLDGPARRDFARTGTSHLMAISGLHIGLVAAAAGFLVTVLWRQCWILGAWLPAVHAGALAGLAAALVYAALAGFAVPTQRALIMLACGVAVLWSRQRTQPFRALAAAMILVLVLAPASVLSAGFWLSFGAVALIIGWLTWRPGSGRWRWASLQGVIGIGLVPVLYLSGMGLSLSGFLVNPPAIAWFGLTVVPLTLLGSLLLMLDPALAEPVLGLAGRATDWALSVIGWFARLPGALIHGPRPGAAAALLAVLGIGLMLQPRCFPGRLLAPLLLAPLWFAAPPRPQLATGEFVATVLDVGQGLSVSVETARHLLLFDAGNGFRSGFNLGSAVVAPFVRTRGWRSIDRVVISHGDTDHAGGLRGLTGELPIKRILIGEGFDLAPAQAELCRRGQAWQWDGVSFEVLYPDAGDVAVGNDASCVLRVGSPGQGLLLTGDIERGAETKLLKRVKEKLSARVVVAPHHGSESSSTPEFVDAVGAEYVVYPTGYANRWGFPRASVQRRWSVAGASGLNTAETGAVSFEFRADGQLGGPRCQRVDGERFWTHRPDMNSLGSGGDVGSLPATVSCER